MSSTLSYIYDYLMRGQAQLYRALSGGARPVYGAAELSNNFSVTLKENSCSIDRVLPGRVRGEMA